MSWTRIASLRPEPVSSRHKFCEVSLFNLAQVPKNERTGKSLDVKIKESHQRGLPLTTQAAAADPERREALISTDSY